MKRYPITKNLFIYLVAILILLTTQTMANPKVALVLGGGSAKGAVHLGVLRAFEEAGIPFDMIVGSSMGAVIGGLYSAGVPINDLDQVLYSLADFSPIELQLPTQDGIFNADPIEVIIRSVVGDMNIGQTPLPFYPTVATLPYSKASVLQSGDLAQGIHASMSILGFINPTQINGVWYYDPGLVANIPAQLAKDLGADFVIAVSAEAPPAYKNGSFSDNILNTLQAISRPQWELSTAANDFLLSPPVEEFSAYRFDLLPYWQQVGYEYTQSILPDLKAALAARGIALRPPRKLGAALRPDWQKNAYYALQKANLQPKNLQVRFQVRSFPDQYDVLASNVFNNQQQVRFGLQLYQGVLASSQLDIGYVTGNLWDIRSSFNANIFNRGYAQLQLHPSSSQPSAWLLGWQWHNDTPNRSNSLSLESQASGGTLRGQFLLHDDTQRLTASAEYFRAWDSSFWQAQASSSLHLQNPKTGFYLEPKLFWATSSSPMSTQQPILGEFNGLRGYQDNSWREPWLAISKLEFGWHDPNPQSVLDVFFNRAQLWGFWDTGYGATRGWQQSLGIGAGWHVHPLTTPPLQLGVEAVYRPNTQTWSIHWRSSLDLNERL